VRGVWEVSTWTSAKDELPPQAPDKYGVSVSVLVCAREFGFADALAVAFCFYGDKARPAWYLDPGFYMMSEQRPIAQAVTHWMSMPEFPGA